MEEKKVKIGKKEGKICFFVSMTEQEQEEFNNKFKIKE